ncbi:nicotinate phosphoribosyltransferase [Uncinocarpus reesii 1704]|uniref:nicotinate phosphoribosyltransferase n=1 Tax=Uncinocarpus reesii (strain UAMH 1704) TaxID=336963 RepID=C4JFM8_UNCRE|nr:nicotinate phosphoribosyltransferase [Uncinocarpus reesii 1704]EEP77513.1 nicotinate phosphoribosyltransferase [Uncinocarpus reesii 1704]
MGSDREPLPEGIFSLLDTDLYKLTMQCAILKYFPSAEVTYAYTNRTKHMKFTREAYRWLKAQIDKFRFNPSKQVDIAFVPLNDTGADSDLGDVTMSIKGLWVETILYEIPLLAITSEAYFKWCDRDWDYHQQEEKAFRKGCTLLEHECIFSEFGSRRRRDYHTQDLVLRGLCRAAEKAREEGWKGSLSGTSNVHFAMKYGLEPVGTVAHEWYMGLAAITDNYENANELALRYWLGCFGEGVLGVALTDTFGTPVFLDAFSKQIPMYTAAAQGPDSGLPSTTNNQNETGGLAETQPPIAAPIGHGGGESKKTYAEVFTGVRQDSGDPVYFVKMVKDFYDKQGIKDKKTIVFSDSLNIQLCLDYKVIAEEAGFRPVFGVGTFLTSESTVFLSLIPTHVVGSDFMIKADTSDCSIDDFTNLFDGKKSVPLNIVIKVSSAGGRPAVKLSDNLGKNTGDTHTVVEVKKRLGYVEHDWENGDETRRWGKKGE